MDMEPILQGKLCNNYSTTVGSKGIGVAPKAKWMGCRNMFGGYGTTETYLNCLEFFLAPTDLDGNNPNPDLRPHVIGNSYGCPENEGCSSTAFNRAVKALRKAGIVMSVSAGNEGPRCKTIATPPATEKLVFSVAATDRTDSVAYFSSRGPVTYEGVTYMKPEISAPGQNIRAAYPGNRYRALSGTSMASPHVGGQVLLMTALCNCLDRNVDAIEDIIQSTAKKLYPNSSQLCGNDTPRSSPNNVYGYGRIDAFGAVEYCMSLCQ